jgi:protein toll
MFAKINDVEYQFSSVEELSQKCTTINNRYKVVTLSLAGNQLESIPSGVLERLSSLEELDLSNNRLTTISNKIFPKLAYIEKLDLSNNLLETLPEDMFTNFTIRQLRHLSLANNRISSLPKNVFYKLLGW